jgi:lysine 2,3-aminomutase
MGVPYFVIDAPGGGGKIRLLPNTVMEHNEKEIIIKNYEGKTYRYPQPANKPLKSKTLVNEKLPIDDPCEILA